MYTSVVYVPGIQYILLYIIYLLLDTWYIVLRFSVVLIFGSWCFLALGLSRHTTECQMTNEILIVMQYSTASILLVCSPFMAENKKRSRRSLVHQTASSSASQHKAAPSCVPPGQGLGWWWWPLFSRRSSHPGCPPNAAIYANALARIVELWVVYSVHGACNDACLCVCVLGYYCCNDAMNDTVCIDRGQITDPHSMI